MEPEPLDYGSEQKRPRRRFPLWAELSVLTILLIVFGYLCYCGLAIFLLTKGGFDIQQH